MTKKPEQFIQTYNGNVIDYDGVYGPQCVDGFKVFCNWAGFPVKPTMTGWADGYWWNRYAQGYSKYFDFITDTNRLQKGDWLFWAYGSKSCQYSHVAMFVDYTSPMKTNALCFGENQGGNRGFRTVNIKLDICGAFRPKMWAIDRTKAEKYVKFLYKTILGREAEEKGLNGWTDSIISGTPIDSVIKGFFLSPEYKLKNTTDETFVKTCYKAYLQREGRQREVTYWTNELKRKSREKVLDAFGGSLEFQKLLKKDIGGNL